MLVVIYWRTCAGCNLLAHVLVVINHGKPELYKLTMGAGGKFEKCGLLWGGEVEWRLKEECVGMKRAYNTPCSSQQNYIMNPTKDSNQIMWRIVT